MREREAFQLEVETNPLFQPYINGFRHFFTYQSHNGASLLAMWSYFHQWIDFIHKRATFSHFIFHQWILNFLYIPLTQQSHLIHNMELQFYYHTCINEMILSSMELHIIIIYFINGFNLLYIPITYWSHVIHYMKLQLTYLTLINGVILSTIQLNYIFHQ